MGRVLAVVNQKGGVGKTTTAINLSAALAAVGRRVLLVDLDPQANSTSGLGGTPGSPTIYHVLILGRPVVEVYQSTSVDGLKLVPSHQDLYGAEIELVSLDARNHRLREMLDPVREHFDFIFVDCPPSLGLLTLNALVAAEGLIVPIQCEYYALEGVTSLMNTVGKIRETLNPRLSIEGILLTMFDERTNLAFQVGGEIRGHFPDHVFETVIPRNVRLAEAPSFGQSILTYDPRSRGAMAYTDLAKEVIRRERAQGH